MTALNATIQAALALDASVVARLGLDLQMAASLRVALAVTGFVANLNAVVGITAAAAPCPICDARAIMALQATARGSWPSRTRALHGPGRPTSRAPQADGGAP